MHIYAIIYAYNLIYCLNNFFYYNVQLKLSAFSHCPPIFWGCGQGVGFSPLPPPYLSSPPPLPPPCLPPPFSERCALRARKIPSLSFFLPSRPSFPSSLPIFSLLPPPHIPLPPIISHLPLTLSAPSYFFGMFKNCTKNDNSNFTHTRSSERSTLYITARSVLTRQFYEFYSCYSIRSALL